MGHVRRVVFSFVYVLLPLVILVCGAQAQPPEGGASGGETVRLEQLLNADGTLNLSSGFSGTVDPTGYAMITGPSGEPRFVPGQSGKTSAPEGGAMGGNPDDSWDDRFFLNGINKIVNSVAISGSDVYIGGNFDAINGQAMKYIARWTGTSWVSLGSGMNGPVGDLAVSGTDVYASGSFTTAGGVSANRIARWDGTTWSALGTGVLGVIALAVGGGNVYAGGSFTTAGGVGANNIARWDGTTWTALGSGTNSRILALAVSGSDVYAGGSFSTAGGVSANYIARWDGVSWMPLGAGLNNEVDAVVVSGADVYAGGSFTTAGGVSANRLARWNGASWSALGSGTNGAVLGLAFSGSDLYVGGQFTTAGGLTANNVARWNGTSWSAVGTGVGVGSFGSSYNSVWSLAIGGSDVYAAGDFGTAGGVVANHLARWNGASWIDVGQSTDGRGVKDSGIAAVRAMVVNGSDLYAAGEFFSAGTAPANKIARWDGTTWSTLGSSMNERVVALAVNGADVYAGGDFTTAGGVSANRIARWDGASWTALGSGMNSSVVALAVLGSDVYAGGLFTTAGGVSTSWIARWNGASWAAVGGGLNSIPRAFAVRGTDLYAGGEFTTAGGVSANRVARWDGANWSALGTGVSSTVRALAVSGSDLYAGGDFSMAGGNLAPGVARWNGTSWSATGLGVSLVYALQVIGGDLYAGGAFSLVKYWNGTVWAPLGSGISGTFSTVSALAMLGSDLYVGGYFTLAGGKQSDSVAVWHGGCGDTLVGSGEQCDEGSMNGASDSCCTGTCQYRAAGEVCRPAAGVCDLADACSGTSGSCPADAFQPGGALCTDDGNVCTDDECNGSGACTHPNNTASCDDGLFCNGADTCGGGACSGHGGDPCASGGECNDICNESADNCLSPSGTSCTDDGNLCTDDECDGAGACTHPNNSNPCDDGLFCNGGDNCGGGSCSVHAGDPCPGTECNTCQETTDSCFDPSGTSCTSDGDVCTDDECDGAGSCVHPNNSAPCDDGVFCNGADTCAGGTCSVHPGDPCTGGGECATACNESADNCGVMAGTPCTSDGDPCTVDACDGMGTCDHSDADADGIGDLCDNCSSETNPDQANDDCPDPSFTACGSPPANRRGCCDGGDACDVCPAEQDNTQCNPNQSTGGNVGTAGGTITTPDGSVMITVPAGALVSDTTISVTENGPQSLFALDRGAVVLRVSLRPENQTFAQALTVRFRWNDRDNDGNIDFGICQGPPSAGLSCDSHAECAPGTCSNTAQLVESQMVLKRNTARFSKSGFGVSPYECTNHLAGSGCETAAADCSDAPGTAEASVALCCDPALNEWSFKTCSFSELLLGLTAGDLIPGGGSESTDCVAEWAVYNPENETYLDSDGFPNDTQTCMDGDAICDADGLANGACEIVVAVCLNLNDPRLTDRHGMPACSSAGVTTWEVTRPRPDGRRPEDVANAVALRDAVLALGTGTVGGTHQGMISFAPVVSQTDHCSAPVRVKVPLRGDGTREGRKTLRVQTATGGPATDSDRVKLVCVPSDVP